MSAQCPRCGCPLDVAVSAREQMPVHRPARDRFDRVRQIQAEVAAAYGITVEQLLSPRMFKRLSLARHVAIHHAARETGLTTSQLGKLFRRDHTTILHAIGRIDGLIESGVLAPWASPDAEAPDA